MHIILFLLFLINISYSYINASEEIKKSPQFQQLKIKQQYKIHNKKRELNTFINSFNEAKEAYQTNHFARAAWTAKATKELFDCYTIEHHVSENIKQELEEILIQSHIKIQKPDLILSEIKKYLKEKYYPREETTQVSFMLFQKSFQVPDHAKKLKKTLTENAFELFSLGNPNTAEIISNSFKTIEDQTTFEDIRNIHFALLWGYATKKENMQAQCFLADAYRIGSYGLEKNIEKTLSYMDYFTESLTKNTTAELPNQRENLYSFLQQQQKDLHAKTLLSYCKYVELSQTANQHAAQKKIFNLVTNIHDKQSSLRKIIFQLLYNSPKASDDLITLLSQQRFPQLLKLFTSSDSDFAIPLLKKQLNTTSYTQEINYLLGLMFYKKNDYCNAYKHFLSSIEFLKQQKNTKSLFKLFNTFIATHKTRNPTHIKIGATILEYLLNQFLEQKNPEYEKKLYKICSSSAYQDIEQYTNKTKPNATYNAICQFRTYHNAAKTKSSLLTEKDIEYIQYALNNNLCSQNERDSLYIKLGLTFYHKEDYNAAFTYLSLAHNVFKEQKDVLALYKMLDSFCKTNPTIDNNHVKNSIIILNDLFSLSRQQIKKFIWPSITAFLEKNTLPYVKILLQEKNYTEIYKLATECILCNRYHIVINIIKEINESLNPNDSDYKEKLNEFYTLAIYQKIKKYALKNITISNQENKQNIDKATTNKRYDCVCQIYAHHFVINNNTSLTKENITYIEHALTNNLCSQTDHKILSALCGDFYLQKGKTSKSIVDYNKAIAYENTYALYKKARLLFNEEENIKESAPIIIDLLEQHIKSNDPLKTKSLNMLGNLYCEYNTRKNAQFFKKNNKEALYYLQESFYCNDFKCASLLGYLYANINTNNEARILKNLRHALVSFEKAIHYAKEFPNKKLPLSLTHMYFNKARIEFTLKYHDEALKSFEKIYLDLDTEEKELALFYMSLCQINNNNQTTCSQEHISSEEKKALEHLAQGYLIREAAPLNIVKINEQILSLIEKYTNHIINNKDNSKKAITECFALGSILYYTTITHEQYAHQYRQHAVNCIEYSAQKDYPKALMTIQILTDKDVHPWNKLTYAEHTLVLCEELLTKKQNLIKKYQKEGINITEMKDNIIIIINNLYPKNIFKLYDYMMYLLKTEQPHAIKRYLQSSQIIKLKDRIPHSPEIQKAIEYLLEQTFLNDYLNIFNSSPIITKKEECNAALMHALLLLQSNQLPHLTKSAQLLNKLNTLTNDTIQLTEHLAYAYYKLGMLQKPNSILHIEYFKKSAQCGDIDASIYLAENFLKNNAEIIKLCKKDNLIEWLSTSIHSLNETSSEKQKSAIALFDALKQNTSTPTAPLLNVNPIIEQIQTIRMLDHVSSITKQRQHPYYFDLVQRNNANTINKIIEADLKIAKFFDFLSQKKIKLALSLINNLVEQKEPAACIALTSYLYLNNDFINAFNAFEKTLTYGLVPVQNSPHKIFINGQLLDMIINFFIEGIKNNTIINNQIKTFWNKVKESLIKHNINMDYFIKYVFDTKEYNLTHNSLWNS